MVYLCSLNFYMECTFFEDSSKLDLEKAINKFIKDKEDVSISLATTKWGYSTYYTAIVCYRVR